jgi:hypothetical protein
MHNDALLTSTTRGEELSYVTKHFRDLQGMRMAPAWAALLLLASSPQTDHFSEPPSFSPPELRLQCCRSIATSRIPRSRQ